MESRNSVAYPRSFPNTALCKSVIANHPELFKITMTIFRPSCFAVCNSCIVIMKSPSPTKPMTCLFGLPSFAPIVAGSVYPIVENPPALIHVLGS